MSVVVGEAGLGLGEVERQRSSVSIHLWRINLHEGSMYCIYFWYVRSLCFSSQLSEEMISVSHLCKSCIFFLLPFLSIQCTRCHLKSFLCCGCSRLILGSPSWSVSKFYKPWVCIAIYCLKVWVNWQIFRNKVEISWANWMLWSEYCMLQYVPSLWTDLYFMLLEHCFPRQLLHIFSEEAVDTCTWCSLFTIINASQCQEINTETCLGWWYSSWTASPVSG